MVGFKIVLCAIIVAAANGAGVSTNRSSNENWWDGLQNQLNIQQIQIESFQKQMEGLKNHLEGLRNNAVPIGFVYVQLSDQPEPSSLWPEIEWENISSAYAGLFFRVLGGGSAAFGKTQNENSPRISEIKNMVGGGSHHINVAADGEWTSPLWTGSDLWCVTPANPCYWSMFFKQSPGEVRPRNQAVQIWKRIK